MDDNLKIKNYEKRQEQDMNGQCFYILSFGQSNHIKVSSRALSIIELLDGTKNKNEILETLEKEDIFMTLEELEYFIDTFLLPKNVLLNKDGKSLDSNKKSKLWFHLPLIESSRFNFLYKFMNILLCKSSVIIILLLVCICTIHAISILLSYTGNVFDEMNSLLILLLVYISMLIHELGHATAAYRYGVNVGKLGIGLYLMYFVFFIDMTNTWRLDKNKRIVNDLSGIYFQLAMIIPIYISYILTNNISLLYAIFVILLAALMNLMPFLRMDGYWLLTDFLNMQNVQVRVIESIKTFIIELKKKSRFKRRSSKYHIDKNVYFYGIYSLAYGGATAVMMIYMIYSFVSLMLNFDTLIKKFSTLYNDLINGHIVDFFVGFNNIFVLVVPVIFIIGFIVSAIKNVMLRKGIGYKNVRMQRFKKSV